MYLHVGGGHILRESAIIGIFDLDSASASADTRRFLSDMQKRQRVRTVRSQLPKSFVLTDDSLFLSPISSSALSKR